MDPSDLVQISQLASMLISEAREQLSLDKVNETGLESSQYRWRLRNSNFPPSEISADSILESHPPRGSSGPPPEIIYPRPPDPSFCSITGTLSEEVTSPLSLVCAYRLPNTLHSANRDIKLINLIRS
jgi:hypothetical protein